ncbi:MAG: hypothetical protein J5716_07900 [Alphaproteobacteria bacterium]|nr:hypothetical protein [Alphaproteobacteria bacterium]
MKKLLIFAVILLSGCATEITVAKRYDVQTPREKVSLAIETYPGSWGNNPLDFASVQQIRQKYFIESDLKEADFILKETSWQKDCSTGGWAYLTVGTIGIIPTWGKQSCTFSYSLTRRENGETSFLSDVQGQSRLYVGWLLMPAIFFPGVRMDGANTLSRAPAMASAIEEAASLIYNPDSRLYQNTQKNRSAPGRKE